MKKFLCILLTLLFCSIVIPQEDLPLQRFNAPLITGGIITRYSPHLIPDNSVQDALNVIFDEDIGIVRRKGYSKYNTSAIGSSTDVRGLWNFTANDGTRYLMAVSNGNLYESDGDGVFATVSGITGLSADAQYDAVAYLGKFWITNGVDNVKSWDGSSTTDVSTAPKGTMIEGWRNRIIISGVSGNQSRVYLSEELDGTNFTTGPTLSTSPVILSIGGLDAKPIKCLKADYKDTLVVFTEDEIYAVYGFGFDDFVVRRVSNEVGCIDDRTVQEKDGNLYWLSRRGLEKWRGTEITRISDPVRDLFDNIISSISDNRFLIDTSQADWEEGNLTANGAGYPISSTQIPASIEPKLNTIEDTDFTQGTVSDEDDLTALDGSLTSIPVYTNVIDTEVEFDEGTYSNTEYSSGVKLEFEDKIPDSDTSTPCQFTNTSFTSQGWTVYPYDGGGGSCNTTWDTCYCASCVPACYVATAYFPFATIPAYVKILDGATEKISYTLSASFYDETVTFTSSQLYNAGLVLGNTYTFRVQDADNDVYIYKDFVWNGGNITSLHIGAQTIQRLNIYSITANGYSPAGTYTSKVYDTGLTTPYYSNFVVTESKPTNTNITYEFAVSSDGVSFDSWVSVANGAIPAVNQKRYYKFRASLSHTRNTTPTITDVTVKAVNSSTYTSDTLNTTFTSPKGGDFSVTKTGTAVTWEVRQSTDGMSWGGWSAQTEDSQILLTQQYWQYRATFTGEVQVTKVTLPARVNSGQYIHKCFNPGTITDWGLFQANAITTEGGSIAYEVVSGATCGAVESPGASWVSQPNNTKIVVATNTYLGVRETFTITKAESNAVLQDVTINYNVGGTSLPLASVVYDDRYLLAFDSDVGGNNDQIAVLDKRDTWTLFDNITCASMSLYSRKWYCGTSETDGFVYLMDTGFNDDGDNFTASFRTKAYWLGDQDAEKEFNKLYVSLLTDNTAPVPEIAVTYRLDDSTTVLSLGSLLTNEDSTSGILQAKVPFKQSQNLTGRYIDFEFSNTGQRPFTIFNFNIYYKLYPIK